MGRSLKIRKAHAKQRHEDMRHWLHERHACRDGIRWAVSHCVDLSDLWNKVLLKEDTPDWGTWLATRRGVLSRRDLVKFGLASLRHGSVLPFVRNSYNAMTILDGVDAWLDSESLRGADVKELSFAVRDALYQEFVQVSCQLDSEETRSLKAAYRAVLELWLQVVSIRNCHTAIVASRAGYIYYLNDDEGKAHPHRESYLLPHSRVGTAWQLEYLQGLPNPFDQEDPHGHRA